MDEVKSIYDTLVLLYELSIQQGVDIVELEAITLMEAYIIENLRKSGVTNKELLHINEQKISEWNVLNDRFDYTILKKLAEKSDGLSIRSMF